jgi:hypothetical protein
MAITLDNLVGMDGGKYTDGTVAATSSDNYQFLVVNEDAIFTTLTDQDDTDVVAEWGVSGKTITKGMIIGPKGDKAFKSVVVASGSVLLIRG